MADSAHQWSSSGLQTVSYRTASVTLDLKPLPAPFPGVGGMEANKQCDQLGFPGATGARRPRGIHQRQHEEHEGGTE